MGTFQLWGAVKLAKLDQFWQMRFQNYCDLFSFLMLLSHLNNDLKVLIQQAYKNKLLLWGGYDLTVTLTSQPVVTVFDVC